MYRDVNRRFYLKHQEELKAYKNTIILCDCGKYTRRVNIARHKRTKVHLKNISTVLTPISYFGLIQV